MPFKTHATNDSRWEPGQYYENTANPDQSGRLVRVEGDIVHLSRFGQEFIAHKRDLRLRASRGV